MNTRISKLTIQTLLGCAMAALAMPALADSTWSNLAKSCTGTTDSMNCGSGTPSGPVLTASAVYDVTATSGVTFAAASLFNYSTGLGVVSTGESSSTTGPHATDNVGNLDAVQLYFGPNAVSLKSLTIGWNGTDNGVTGYSDSDLSVLAWMGAGAPPASSTLGSAGWKLVGNYADVGVNGTNVAGGTATISPTTTYPALIYSSYWLISAYSTAFGGNTATNLDGGNDAFKLLGVVASTNPGGKVPEPGSIALIGAGLLGLFVRARRKQANGA